MAMLNNNVPELVDDLADLAVVRLGRGPCPPSQTPDQVRFTEAYEQGVRDAVAWMFERCTDVGVNQGQVTMRLAGPRRFA